MEIFLLNGLSYFLNFPSREFRSSIYHKIIQLAIKNRPNLTKKLNLTLQQRSKLLVESWMNKKISNFEYLMKLNQLAGRTYNDISQYPVFPWILTDYTSETLDLNDHNIYRDLSKPIGALNPQKLKMFQKKYKHLKREFDQGSEIIPFYYGSHYSSAQIVFYYLIRLEPFTTLFLTHQSGQFDRADRMFNSVENAWRGSFTSSSDLKELIPEFYYLPGFLDNSNNFDLGIKQTGEKVNDVKLPPWANGSPENFIRIMREALESDHVSAHLNEWVDLIFGYKQKGEEAIKSFNLFYYLTYEDNVNLDSIENEKELNRIISQIENYGQTPIQLFKNKLQSRNPGIKNLNNNSNKKLLNENENKNKNNYKKSVNDVNDLFHNNLNKNLSNNKILQINIFETSPLSISSSPILFLSTSQYFSENSQDIIIFDQDRNLIFEKITIEKKVIKKERLSLETNDFLRILKKKIGYSFSNSIYCRRNCFKLKKKKKVFYSCGYWDNSFKINQLGTSILIQNNSFHSNVVTCLKNKKNYLITGSKDSKLVIWYIKNNKVINTPKMTIYDHKYEITSIDFNLDLDLIVSGSKNGHIFCHSFHTGKILHFIKQLNYNNKHYSPFPASLIKILKNGFILICCNNQIFLLNNNMEIIFYKILSSKLIDWYVSNSEQFLIFALKNGRIEIWQIWGLKMLIKNQIPNVITAFYFKGFDKRVLIGTKNGLLVIGKFKSQSIGDNLVNIKKEKNKFGRKIETKINIVDKNEIEIIDHDLKESIERKGGDDNDDEKK
ncbi:beige/beach-related [Anaeramoeba flamelloides]|uniref:Beige/beach-related n=1 Tax=Anaeramoeba flamelloides TaxID=1746091 RepID=A0ABQ8Y6F1_9EUKA|nr:beige/beach-related [Anaeramoeba flamelloides]